MGEAKRRKREKRESRPMVVWTLLVPKELDQAAKGAHAEVETARKAKHLGGMAFSDFAVFGLMRAGLENFYAAKKAHEESQRVIVTPDQALIR